MDYDYWVSFYKKWEIEDLVREIGNCHLYQQDLLARAGQKSGQWEILMRYQITSQQREMCILQAIMEKLKNVSNSNQSG